MIQLDLIAKIQNRVFRREHEGFFVVNQTRKFIVTMNDRHFMIIQERRGSVIDRFVKTETLFIR